ncbi:YgiT-type zinc finger protein [Brevibacillus laterosporus]|nr:YgiT-type zinc finger protein [Brevibacillus laterosporus]
MEEGGNMCPLCETKLELRDTKITANYRDKEIKVTNVPLYHCDCRAYNCSPRVRIQIKQRLREAFNGSRSEIEF